MDYHVEEQQASRLKEILFPRKTRASRTTVKSFYETGKENNQANRTHKLKEQITKLKRGMQAFIEKQEHGDNCLATPRECLELIKLMSDRLENYGEEIEEAVNNLIENIPYSPPAMSHTKYFTLHIKLNLLHSSFFFARRRILGNAFDHIKRESDEVLEMINLHENSKGGKSSRQKVSKFLQVSSAFNKWRLNICKINKHYSQTTELYEKIEGDSKVISLLSDESKLLLWLQKSVQGDADVAQILIFNHKNATLRSYVNTTDHLSSVFETVQNQSQAGDEPQKSKIKRIEFNLEHSLTKICLIKRQPLRIDEVKRDPDFSKIDNLASTHGLSAREMAGGAIFTPILNSMGHSIGIIRQYYFDKPGSILNFEIVGEIGRILERGLKTNEIIDKIKEKALGIRRQYYLKSIQLMNSLANQRNQQQISQCFQQRIIDSFPIQSMREYSYETVTVLGDRPKFVINSTEESEQYQIQVLTALGKMHHSHTHYLYENNDLIIKTFTRVYVFRLCCNEEGIQENVPVNLLKNLLERKQQISLQKVEQIRDKKMAEEKARVIEKEERERKRKNQILQYCLNCSAPKKITQTVRLLQDYCDQFGISAKVALKLVKTAEVVPENSNQIELYSHEQFKIVLEGEKKTEESQELTSLKKLCQFLTDCLFKVNPVKVQNLDLLSWRHWKIQQPIKAIIDLICEVGGVQESDIDQYDIPKNCFDDSYFITYVQASRLGLKETKQSSEQLVKVMRKYSSVQKIQSEPLKTIIVLNEAITLIINKYLLIDEESLMRIDQILRHWIQLKAESQQFTQKSIRNQFLVKGFHKISKITLAKSRDYFTDFKSKTKNKKFTLSLSSFMRNLTLQNLGRGFNQIMEASTTDRLAASQAHLGIQKIRGFVNKVAGVSSVYRKWERTKKLQKTLSIIHQIHQRGLRRITREAFDLTFYRQFVVHSNKFYVLEEILLQQKRTTFEWLRKADQRVIFSSGPDPDSQCSTISKMRSFVDIARSINAKYPQYQVYLQMKDGNLLLLNSTSISSYTDQLPHNTSSQYLQFPCTAASPLKHITWLVPQSITISLLQKHYLQALSKSIEEGFKKFEKKSQAFLFFISHLDKKQTKKVLEGTLKQWRINILKQIRNEEYKWRESFYEANVEVQNLKLMEKQYQKEEEQRNEQIKEIMKVQHHHERKLSENRQAIVRLQISSRKLQEQEIEAKGKRNLAEMKRFFQKWRLQSAQEKKEQTAKFMHARNNLFGVKFLGRTVECKEKDHLRSAFKMILVKFANDRALGKSESANKNLKSKQPLGEKDFNRLMTFQDEFENCMEEKSRDVSIIPISFKQFEASSKRENMGVSEEEARKINGGAYKLNPKTLKFLKRMGKINNE